MDKVEIKKLILPKYVLKFTDNHEVFFIDIEFKNVRKITNDFYLIKFKRQITTPRFFQIKSYHLKIKNKHDGGLCKKLEEHANETEEQVVIIVEFYNGEPPQGTD